MTDTRDSLDEIKMDVKLVVIVAIKLMDKSIITYPEVKDLLINLAIGNNIKY